MENFTRLSIKRIASSSVTPVEILKGTLHSIKLEEVARSITRVNPQRASKKGLTWDLPKCELLALSSVLQVLVCVAVGSGAGGGWRRSLEGGGVVLVGSE